MPGCMQRRWRSGFLPHASRFAARSSGASSTLYSAAALITGNTSPAGMRCERGNRPIGGGTARNQSTVWDVPNANPHGGSGQAEQTGHGTQKPVELMRRPILNHTVKGEAVYDGFLGSGSTLIAAELTERICYG